MEYEYILEEVEQQVEVVSQEVMEKTDVTIDKVWAEKDRCY